MSTNLNKNTNHSYFMKLALEQAKKNLGCTKENPSVGCIIVKNNLAVAAGSTSLNGRPHAERNAINSSHKKLKNSCLYATLEPCSNYGKTAPCVNLIIKKGIKKVFFSIKDPDIRSYNKSSKIFKKSNIKINIGLCSPQIKSFYRSYVKSKSNKLPFVTCKIAASKDFFAVDKNNKWITNKYSRGRVHLLRSSHDCIITSAQTIISDDSLLTCRINGLEKRSPPRIILDAKLRTPIKSRIIKELSTFKTIIFYNKENKKKIKLLKRLKIKIFKIDLDKNQNLDLKKALYKVKKLGFSRVFLESGIRLANSFLNDNLVDDFKLFLSNTKLKKNGKASIKFFFSKFLKNKKKYIENVNLFGDKLTTYKIK